MEYKNSGANVSVKQNIFDNNRIISKICIDEGTDDSLLYPLIQEAEADEKKSGAKRLFARFVESKEEILFSHEIITKAGYFPVLLNGHHLEYDLNSINKERLLVLRKKLGESYKNVLDFSHVSKEEHRKFYEKLSRIHRAPIRFSSSKEFNRYYKTVDGLVGYLAALKTTDGEYISPESIVISPKDINVAYPGMIVSLLLTLKMLDDAKRITFQFTDEGFYNGILNILGDPDVNKLIFEYVKKL